MTLKVQWIFITNKNSNISIERTEAYQNQFKSKLNEKTTGNPKPKSKDQLDTIKMFIAQEIKLSNYKIIMLKLYLKLYIKQNREQDLKIFTPKQMLQRLPTALQQVKAGNNSENSLNEIRQIVYSLYQSKKLLRNYTIT